MSGRVQFNVSTQERTDVIDITNQINNRLKEIELDAGVNVWVPHTTAAVTVNEAADPAVMRDVTAQLADLVPWDNNYQHMEGNSAAHIKSILTDCHQWLPVQNGKLDLGRWQGVFFLEWDGPRTRKVQLYPG